MILNPSSVCLLTTFQPVCSVILRTPSAKSSLHSVLSVVSCSLQYIILLQAVLALTGESKSDHMEFQSVMIEQIADNARILKVSSQLALTWCQPHKHAKFADFARPILRQTYATHCLPDLLHSRYSVHQYA